MHKKLISLTLVFALTASLAAEARTDSYLEVSSVLREHSYDLDIIDGSNRYFIDELYRGGWKVEGGWSVAPNWTLIADYSRHRTDNADGVILTTLTRVQAPIFYVYRRMSLGIRKSWPLSDGLSLDTTLRYQRTDQGVGNFFIENGDLTFGLNTVERDKGTAAEVALRKERGNWAFEVQAGYDPHAGFELTASDIDVESDVYAGAGAEYHFGEHFKLGLEARHGKVTDLAIKFGVMF